MYIEINIRLIFLALSKLLFGFLRTQTWFTKRRQSLRNHPLCRKQEILNGEAEQKHQERTESLHCLGILGLVERDEASGGGDQPPRPAAFSLRGGM